MNEFVKAKDVADNAVLKLRQELSNTLQRYDQQPTGELYSAILKLKQQIPRAEKEANKYK